MRIIAGAWRGRTIRAPTGAAVRPTGDRAREAWMSRVHPLLPGARVVDLFAGSGALGLEALSRGAATCDFVDDSAESLRVVRGNVEALGATPRAHLHRGDALRFAERLAPRTFDIAFADPPYHRGLASQLVQRWQSSPFAHVLGVEHDVHEDVPPGGTTRRYGGSAITLYGME